jgi:stage III sporulation protein AF
VAILTPLLHLFKQDFPNLLQSFNETGYVNEDLMKNEIEMKKTEIQASQDAYIVEQMAVQMKNQVKEGMIDEYDMTIKDLVIHTTKKTQSDVLDDVISKVLVVVEQKEVKDSEDDAIEVVQEVKIDSSKEPKRKQPSNEEANISRFLADNWQLSEEKIVVEVEGG